MRVKEEITIEVVDDEGEVVEITVELDGLWTQASRHDPGEIPDIHVPVEVPDELRAEVRRVAWETWVEKHHRDEERDL